MIDITGAPAATRSPGWSSSASTEPSTGLLMVSSSMRAPIAARPAAAESRAALAAAISSSRKSFLREFPGELRFFDRCAGFADVFLARAGFDQAQFFLPQCDIRSGGIEGLGGAIEFFAV